MHVPKSQRGIGLPGWIAILLLVIGAAVVSIRVGPAIADHVTLMGTIESIQEDPEFHDASMRDIKRAFNTRMRVNNVDHLKEHIDIHQPSGRLVFTVQYNVEQPLFGNAYILLKFDEQVGGRSG